MYNAYVLHATARRKILDCVLRLTPVSAAQISRAISISAASVRYHLRVLCADGRIVLVGEMQRGGRGRPVKLYRASDRLLGDNLAMLSETLLESWRGAPTAERDEQLLQVLVGGLMGKIGTSEPRTTAAKRLAWLVARMNALHYQARWEAAAQGPRILFSHCPYAEIIEAHPELCRMDAGILSHQMSAVARQVSKIDLRPGGSPHCVFVLG